ncbi:protein of unknown function [Hyphomicrobium sp. 1Nfss2.1]
MGKFFREFNDRPQSSSPSFTILLMGMLMFGGMAWLLHWVSSQPPMTFTQALAHTQALTQ